MAITWKNIGQSANSGNSLIAGASDTIAQGINSIQAAAQSVTDEQNRQYETQADVNTANILSDINRLDQDGVDNFDVGALSNQFGSQFDATGVANALDNRINTLREAAQQEADNANRDLITDSRLATDQLNRDNLTGQIAAREEAKRKADKFNAFNREASNNLANYSSLEDLTRKVTQAGQKAGQSPQEINQAIQSASQTYNNNIELNPNQKAMLTERAALQAQQVKQSVAFQNNQLENDARALGIIPELAELSTTPDSKETSIKALNEQYGPLIKGAGFGEQDSVTAFQTKLAKRFKESNLPSPNGAELKYFLQLGFDEGTFGTDDGLDIGSIEKEINQYIKMRENRSALRDYNKAKSDIQRGAEETAKAQAKDLKTYASTMRANNKARFTGEAILFDNPIPNQVQDRRTTTLTQQNWFQE